MKVYLSARYRRRLEMRGIRDELEKRGCQVVSQWIDETYGSFKDVSSEYEKLLIAKQDKQDMQACDLFILFSDEGKTTHGMRFFEHGYVSALGKAVWIVGKEENYFQWLEFDPPFKNIEQVYNYIDFLNENHMDHWGQNHAEGAYSSGGQK